MTNAVVYNTYLALGDSISIDDYTGVPGGGAVSQFARKIGAAKVVNLTRDGRTTRGVLEALTEIGPISPDIVTLTAGGNDLLECALEFRRPAGSSPVSPKEAADRIIENYKKIAVIFVGYGCPVIVNTVYDPSGGSDDLVKRMGIAPQWRETYNRLNAFIRSLPETMGFGSRTCKRCSMATVSPPTIRGL